MASEVVMKEKGTPFHGVQPQGSEEAKQYVKFPEGTKVRIHDFQERFGLRIKNNPIRLTGHADDFVERAKTSMDFNIRVILEIVRTVQAYEKAGKPLNYATFWAHFWIESEREMKKFSRYALCGLYAQCPGTNPIFTSWTDGEGVTQGTSRMYSFRAVFEEIVDLFTRVKTPMHIQDIRGLVGVPLKETQKRDWTFAAIDYSLNVLDAAGNICKLPASTRRGSNQYGWIPTRLRYTPSSIPEDNLGFVLLSKFYAAGQFIESEAQTVSEPEGFAHFKTNHRTLLINSGLLVRGPKIQQKDGAAGVYVYYIPDDVRKMVERTVNQGWLDEELRQRLLGKNSHCLSKWDTEQIIEIETFLRVWEIHERYGTSAKKIAADLGCNWVTAGGYLYHKRRPMVLTGTTDHIMELVEKVPDEAKRQWMLDGLRKRGILPPEEAETGVGTMASMASAESAAAAASA